MNVFVPYREPFKCAQCLDPRRLNKQIIECQQILDAIHGYTNAWANHPCVLQYNAYPTFIRLYRDCLLSYKYGNIVDARIKSNKALEYLPSFITEGFCINMRKRLYTKDPEYYFLFKQYGTTEENWYFVNGELCKYINGKQV